MGKYTIRFTDRAQGELVEEKQCVIYTSEGAYIQQFFPLDWAGL